MSGTSLSTKGLISGGGAEPTPEPAPPTPPGEPPRLETATPTGTIMIVIPTAINTVLMASENIIDNLRARQKSSLTLPSMYKRAYLVAYETDEIAVFKE